MLDAKLEGVKCVYTMLTYFQSLSQLEKNDSYLTLGETKQN